jgi:hypothetical protein
MQVTPKEKLRAMKEAPGEQRYFSLHAVPSRDGGKYFVIVRPGLSTRPMDEIEALLYITNRMEALATKAQT